MRKGIGGHQSARMINDEWLTPPEIIHACGLFDLDPCAPVNRPWDTAKLHYTKEDNGLILPWDGRVWLNPPYGDAMIPFLHKLSQHGNGIALTFARTCRKDFHRYVFEKADSILFLEGRLTFYTVEGMKAKANGGAPSVLIAYGEQNVEALDRSGIKGHHQIINNIPVVVISVSPSWKSVVSIALTRLNGKGSVQAIYDMVERIAPDKIRKNQFYKAKVRQKLQAYFSRQGKGYYSLN